MTIFTNLAGVDEEKADEQCAAELGAAGIEVVRLPFESKGEVKTNVLGDLSPWGFRRAWYYWVAEGPGIPPDIAEELHAEHGKAVRVDGHCMCPSPTEWFKGFGVSMYHVDTQDGLNALAEVIRRILNAS